MYIDGQNHTNFNLNFSLEPQVRAREEENCRLTLLLTHISASDADFRARRRFPRLTQISAPDADFRARRRFRLLTQIVKTASTKFPMTDTLTFNELVLIHITHILVDRHRLL